jgi:hypothetical protein
VSAKKDSAGAPLLPIRSDLPDRIRDLYLAAEELAAAHAAAFAMDYAESLGEQEAIAGGKRYAEEMTTAIVDLLIRKMRREAAAVRAARTPSVPN